MNGEDALELIWAKKTSKQQIQSLGEREGTFVCPFCGATAHVCCLNDEYVSYCSNGCFGERRN